MMSIPYRSDEEKKDTGGEGKKKDAKYSIDTSIL